MATKLGTILADFTTNLASVLTLGLTTATLQNVMDNDGLPLVAGQYFFTLDGENSNKEHISCTLGGNALTNIKSISRQGVQTTGVVRTHRIGTTVSLTDFAHIMYMNDLLSSKTGFDSTTPIRYDGPAIPILSQFHIPTWDYVKAYADTIVTAGAPDASFVQKGITKLTSIPITFLGACTMTIASPAVITSTAHGLIAGDTVQFTSSGALPTGLVSSTNYYVISAGLTANNFELATTFNGSPINTTGTQSGTQNLFRTTPLAVGNDDTRLPTQSMRDAMQVITTPPSNGNRFLTQAEIPVLTPTGAMTMFAGTSAPTGWLFCDGSAVSRSTYSGLFSILSTTFGVGDGSTTFNVPDMRGRVPVGVGTGVGGGASGTGAPTGGTALTAVPRAGWKGEETHLLTAPEMPSHTHGIQNWSGGSGGVANQLAAVIPNNPLYVVQTGSAGGDIAHNNIQPVMGINFIIKT